MARIRMIGYEEADGELKQLYDQLKEVFGGRVPNAYRILSVRPDLLKVHLAKRNAVMTRGELPRRTKEMIALVVSKANNCEYCVRAHSNALRKMQVDEGLISKLLQGLDEADLDLQTRKILEFALAVNNSPSSITDAQVEELRRLGLSDGQILEAVMTAEVYSGINKILDSLGVELDV